MAANVTAPSSMTCEVVMVTLGWQHMGLCKRAMQCVHSGGKLMGKHPYFWAEKKFP